VLPSLQLQNISLQTKSLSEPSFSRKYLNFAC
jgi:hypothetical protein